MRTVQPQWNIPLINKSTPKFFVHLKLRDHAFIVSVFFLNKLPHSISLLCSSLYTIVQPNARIVIPGVFQCACFPLLRPYNTQFQF